MFLPVRADFPLPGFPALTILVCIVCTAVFLKQQGDWKEFEFSIERYCDGSRSRIDSMVLQRVDRLTGAEICGQAMYEIHNSPDPDRAIEELVQAMKPLSGLSREDSQEYTRQILRDELRRYRSEVPDDPDSKLAYNTASWNPVHMITASFAHGDWGHIAFNLIFFFAFAATVEKLAGPLAFLAFVIVCSLLIGVTDSIVSTLADDHHWTLGLSGVVMGVMGLFAYLIPHGKIRCYYWIIVIFGSVALPGWLLALWYIGGDAYQLIVRDDHGGINVLAHVAGGVVGYCYGFFFLKSARENAVRLQKSIDHRQLMPGS